jgi:hypothetical protein
VVKANTRTPLLRVAGWSAYASGVVAISGLVPIVTYFAFGVNIPRFNDTAAIVQYLFALPTMLALCRLMQERGPVLSMVAMWLGIVGIGIGAFAVVQILWLFGSIGVTSYYVLLGSLFLMIGAWLVLTGQYLRRSIAEMPYGLLISILAATYVAYPIWATWLGHLLLSGKLAVSGNSMGGASA